MDHGMCIIPHCRATSQNRAIALNHKSILSETITSGLISPVGSTVTASTRNSMDVPPPYYTTVAALQAENQDLSSTIRRLSNETIKLDSLFQSVYIALSLEENFDQSSATPSSEWKVIREVCCTGLMENYLS